MDVEPDSEEGRGLCYLLHYGFQKVSQTFLSVGWEGRKPLPGYPQSWCALCTLPPGEPPISPLCWKESSGLTFKGEDHLYTPETSEMNAKKQKKKRYLKKSVVSLTLRSQQKLTSSQSLYTFSCDLPVETKKQPTVGSSSWPNSSSSGKLTQRGSLLVGA